MYLPLCRVLVCSLAMVALTVADLGKGADASWLLMVEAGQGEGEDRRITQKSIFIGPQLGPRAHRCKEGHRYNHLGNCVKVVRPVNPPGQFDLLLHRLQTTRPTPSIEKLGPPSAGPLHFSLPLNNLLENKPTEVAPKVNLSLSEESQGLPTGKPSRATVEEQSQNETSVVTIPPPTAAVAPATSTHTTAAPPRTSPPELPVASSETPPDRLLELFLQRLRGSPAGRVDVIPSPLFEEAQSVRKNTTTLGSHSLNSNATDGSLTSSSFLRERDNVSSISTEPEGAKLDDPERALDLFLKRLRGELTPNPSKNEEAQPFAPPPLPVAGESQREGSGEEVSVVTTAVPLLEKLGLEQHLPLTDGDQHLDNESVALRSTEKQDIITTEQDVDISNTTEESFGKLYSDDVDSSSDFKSTEDEGLTMDSSTLRSIKSEEDVSTTEPLTTSVVGPTTDVDFSEEGTTIWLPYIEKNLKNAEKTDEVNTKDIGDDIKDFKLEAVFSDDQSANNDSRFDDLSTVDDNTSVTPTSKPITDDTVLGDDSSTFLMEDQSVMNGSVDNFSNYSAPANQSLESLNAKMEVRDSTFLSKDQPSESDAVNMESETLKISDDTTAPTPDTLHPTDFRLSEGITVAFYPSTSSVQSSRLESSSSFSVQSTIPFKPSNTYFPASRFSTIAPDPKPTADTEDSSTGSSFINTKSAVPNSQKPPNFFPESPSFSTSVSYNSKHSSFFPDDRTNSRTLNPNVPKQFNFFPEARTPISLSQPSYYPSPLSFGAKQSPDPSFSSSSSYDSLSHSYSTSVSGFDASSGSGFASTGSGFYPSPSTYEASGSPFDFTGSGYVPPTTNSGRYVSESSGDSVVPPFLLFEEVVSDLYNKTALYQPQVSGS